MGPLPSGLVTFVFTDVEGSTKLFRALGPRYAPLLEAHRHHIRVAIEAHGGVEVSTEGDGFFLAFDRPSDALAGCVDAQLALESHAWPDDGRVRVRMGIHTGEAEPINGDYISITVHEAARVAAIAHGGQIVVSPQAAEHLDVGQLRPLGSFWLRDFDQPLDIHQVVHQGLPDDFPELRARRAGATTLRRRRSVFLGRVQEMAQATSALQPGAVLTITGPGGAGKTRLAETVASGVEQAGRPVVFVPLAAVGDGHVLRALADALDAGQPGATDLIEVVRARLDDRALIVLDNCEHVLPAAARVIDDLLDRSPELSFLVTSRQPLRLADEQVLALGSLGVDAGDDDVPAPAVELFARRAAAAAGRPIVTDDNELVATEICRRLDGLPFAIELAAARAASLPLPELLTRLTDRFALLDASAARRGDGRYETLFQVIEWSERLLQPDAAVLLRRVSLFRGGFTLAGAQSVCGYGDVDPDQVPLLLSDLVEASLVTFNRRERYDVLETIREFGRRRLTEAGEDGEVVSRLLDWLSRVVEVDEIRAGRVGASVAAIDAESENIAAVLALRDVPQQVHVAQTVLALSLRRWFDRSGRYLEGWSLLADLIEAGPLPLDVEAEARAAVAFLAFTSYEMVDVTGAAAHAVALARQSGHTLTLAFALNCFAVSLERSAHLEPARAALTEAIDLLAGRDAPVLEIAVRFNHLAALLDSRGVNGASAEDRSLALQALADAVEGSDVGEAQVMLSYGRAQVLWALSRDDEAETAALHGLALARTGGHVRFADILLFWLTDHSTDKPRQAGWLRQSSELWRSHPDRVSAARGHASMAIMARRIDDDLAAELIATARDLARTLPEWVSDSVERRLRDDEIHQPPVGSGPVVPTAALPRPRPRE
jgi:predicted ATPase/class 3 adenylate cyclase